MKTALDPDSFQKDRVGVIPNLLHSNILKDTGNHLDLELFVQVDSRILEMIWQSMINDDKDGFDIELQTDNDKKHKTTQQQ